MSCKSFDADSYPSKDMGQRFRPRKPKIPDDYCYLFFGSLSDMSAHMNKICIHFQSVILYVVDPQPIPACNSWIYIDISAIHCKPTYTGVNIHGTAACIKCYQQTPHFFWRLKYFTVVVKQGLVNVPFGSFWGFWTSHSSICWRSYPQYLSDLQLRHWPTHVKLDYSK